MVSLGEELVSGLMVLASEIEDGVSRSIKFGSLAFALRVRVEAESGLELEKRKLQFFVSRPYFFNERFRDSVSSFLFSSISAVYPVEWNLNMKLFYGGDIFYVL